MKDTIILISLILAIFFLLIAVETNAQVTVTAGVATNEFNSIEHPMPTSASTTGVLEDGSTYSFTDLEDFKVFHVWNYYIIMPYKEVIKADSELVALSIYLTL